MRKLVIVVALCFSLGACSTGGLVNALTGDSIGTVAEAVPDALNEVQEIVDEITPDGPVQRVKVGDNSVVDSSQRPISRNEGVITETVEGDQKNNDGGAQIETVERDFIQYVYNTPWQMWAIFGALLWVFWELPRSTTIYAWVSNRWKSFRKQ